jgi:iron complex outermembrane receptor protein
MRLHCLCLAAAIAAWNPIAHANDATAVASDSSLDEIIVTAERRSENAQRTPIAIKAINGATLQQQGINNAQSLSVLVPSVTVGTYGPYSQVFLRGIGDFGGTPVSESPIAVNLDQVYQASPALTGSYFYDIDRVELLMGPQGTLYGRNASGGALNIITKQPDFSGLNGYVSVGFGNYSAGQFEGAVNIPVNSDLAIRASGQVLSHDGYYQDGYDDDRRQGGRLEALYRPTSGLSILLVGDYEHQGGKGGGASITPNPIPGNPWIGVSDPRSNAVIAAVPGLGPFLPPVRDDGHNHVDTWGIMSNVEWDLGPVTLALIPAYRYYDIDVVTYTSGNFDRVVSPQHQYSVEARLGSATDGPLKYTLGVYYYNNAGDGFYAADFGPVVEQILHTVAHTSDESAAAFGQATFSVTDTLRFTGGLRYTYERKTIDSGLVSSPTFSTTTFSFEPCLPVQTTVAAPQGVGFLPGSSFFCTSSADGRLTDNKVTWKAGLEYDLAPQSLLYLTAGTGFKAGGIYQGGAPNTFAPETLLAYELGSKNRFLDNTLQVNLEAFFWKYNDQQISSIGVINPPPVLGYLVRNAGESTLAGLDLDIQYRFTAHDTVSLSAEYLHTNYGRFEFPSLSFVSNAVSTGCKVTSVDPVNVDVNCAGKPLVRAPEWSGSASYEHVFDLSNIGSLTFGARTKVSSGYYTSFDYVPGPGYQKSFTNSSIDLTYISPKQTWLLSAYVKNIENSAVSVGSFENGYIQGVFFNSLAPPRTYGVRARYNF